MISLDLNLWPALTVLAMTALSLGGLRLADAWEARRARLRGEQLLSKVRKEEQLD